MTRRDRRWSERLATVAVPALVVAALLPIAPARAAGAQQSLGTVAVIGDFGSGTPDEQAVADLVASADPIAVVTTGDNVYSDAGYARLVGRYYAPWVRAGRLLPAVGNHDHENGLAAFDAYFPRLQGRHVYSAGAGGIRFFFLDSTQALDSPTSLARQRAWLERSLRASPARWKVVVLHHPPYSSGTVHGSSPELRWPFGDWGADLVLSGHEHNYERLAVGGASFIVDGAGGKDLYPLGARLPGEQARDDADFGALFLTASRTELTGEFRSVAGRIVDRFAVR